MVILTLIYALAGLFGRDPWKTDDAVGFGVMWTMANGQWMDWLLPHLAGRADIVGAPLPYWLGASFIWLFGDLIGATNAARLITALCFMGSAATIWYATYLLGRRAEVQPMEFALGGQPQPRDYGRTLADGALLIFLACVGLAQRAHETSPLLLQLFGLTLLLYGAIRGLDKALQGGILAGIGLAIMSLSATLIETFILCGVTLIAFLICQTKLQWRWVLSATGILTLGLLVWPILWLMTDLPAARISEISQIWWGKTVLQSSPSWQAITFFNSNFWFYAWPVWPLSIWGFVHWGKKGSRNWRSPHLILPAALLFGEVVFFLFLKNLSEEYFIILIPPLAILAAFSLPFLKRGFISFIDWLALISFTIVAGFIWVIWLAKMTGFPKATADNVARYIPGFVGRFSWTELIIALVVTGLWILVVKWRTSRAPKEIWRCVVISAAGTTLMWVLLMTLWLPTIDYAKTYRHVAHRFAQAIQNKNECVDSSLLGDAQLASFIYFTKIKLEDNPNCRLLLTHSSKEARQSAMDNHQIIQLIWEDRRDSDRDERLKLYRVTPKQR